MSKIVDALRQAEAARLNGNSGRDDRNKQREFDIVTIASNKGGVGKTTIASNLAVYLRALREDEPVLMLGLDDQTTLDRMFALDSSASEAAPGDDIADGLREQSLERVTRFGQYGVDYVPTSRDLAGLRNLIGGPGFLRQTLMASRENGTVVIDTKSDFEKPTCAAILASDLTLVIVKDQASLLEARRTFDLLEKAKRPRESAKILLSLVDKRVKYHEGEQTDVLAHLLGQIRSEGYPVFETFISRSPKVESLYTNPKGSAVAILQGAKQSGVHRQMIQLTREVARDLESARSARSDEPSPDAKPHEPIEAASTDRREPTPPTPPTAPAREKMNAPARKGPRFWSGVQPLRDR